ncbi:helix-turn-helix domain-containing protein [Streptomyces sp. NBC_00344]|uniref:helix-turn-helix domain-containing protein n=1 Tax=Streptomyces sp. NBC_00344 TaxID=2975720 RepID=UPI002E1C07F0
MHVEHLLRDDSLGLRLLWGEDALLRREISGVTATDLEDPGRFVRPGEVVLSGLVWWTPQRGKGRAERFVSALRAAGAAALMAGEETHGRVPDELVQACRRHGLPVAAVPTHVMFRTITDTVYLQQWGELSRHRALPEAVHARLARLLVQDADPATLLEGAFAHLGRPAAYLLTPSGRTVAATEDATAITAREAARLLGSGTGITVRAEAGTASAYERWYLYLPDPGHAPPRMLHEIAAFMARCQESLIRSRATGHRAADELAALLDGAGTDTPDVEAALRSCGLPASGPYRVLCADAGPGRAGQAAGALAEAVAHVMPERAATGCLPDGTAFAVLAEARTVEPAPGDADAVSSALSEVWLRLAACEPSVSLHGGISEPAARARDMKGALAQARYALASARTTTPGASSLSGAAALTGLAALLSGIPQEVRTAYSRTVLGPLLDGANTSAALLLETLETFLARDGSWARTAEALHLHVNTVHYRIGRIELFTGRDLSRLDNRLDLRAALLCRALPGFE